ncbi:MAG TPA: hypothetical protein VGG28_24565 [Kofleriaceae bacterium]|jgi:hypothetical protein
MRALVFSILLVGCGGSPSTPPASPTPPTPVAAGSATAGSDAGSAAATAGPSVESMIAKMGEFKDKLCACPDQTCAEGIGDEMKTWTQDLAKQGVKDPHLTDAQAKRLGDIRDAFGTCMRRISNMGG